MYGIDFVDTIVVRRSVEKGTKTIIEPLKSMKWAGSEFKEAQEAKLSKFGSLKIASAKGTSTVDLTKMSRTILPKLGGHYISTRRGTELLRL
jgi:hypothetical protein